MTCSRIGPSVAQVYAAYSPTHRFCGSYPQARATLSNSLSASASTISSGARGARRPAAMSTSEQTRDGLLSETHQRMHGACAYGLPCGPVRRAGVYVSASSRRECGAILRQKRAELPEPRDVDRVRTC